jgi:hypothetical protein
MARKKHTLEEVLKFFSRRKGVKIKDKVIQIDKRNNDLGNGCWGRIDYLRNVHGYTWFYSKR